MIDDRTIGRSQPTTPRWITVWWPALLGAFLGFASGILAGVLLALALSPGAGGMGM